MKKTIFSLLLVAFGALSMQAQRFAVVDVDYILGNMPAYEEAQTRLDEQAAVWRQDIDKKYDEIKGLYNKYQAEQVLLSDDERLQREDDIVSKEKGVREMQKQRFGAEGDLFRMRQELVAPIQDKVFSAIEDYAAARGLDFIFDKGGSVGILFANPDFDKTDDILAKLRR